MGLFDRTKTTASGVGASLSKGVGQIVGKTTVEAKEAAKMAAVKADIAAVQAEIDRKPAGKAIDGHRIAAHKERGCPDAGRRGACHSFTPDPSARHILYGSHQHCKSARERQQYGNQQKQRAQDPSPPAYMINKPIRDQIPGSKFRFHEPFPDLSGLRLRIQGCRQKYFQKGRPAKSSRRE